MYFHRNVRINTVLLRQPLKSPGSRQQMRSIETSPSEAGHLQEGPLSRSTKNWKRNQVTFICFNYFGGGFSILWSKTAWETLVRFSGLPVKNWKLVKYDLIRCGSVLMGTKEPCNWPVFNAHCLSNSIQVSCITLHLTKIKLPIVTIKLSLVKRDWIDKKQGKAAQIFH